MLNHIPLDVMLSILESSTLEDVLRLFATCKRFRGLSDLRPLWVYFNVVIDWLQFRPGRGSIDYSDTDVIVLRERVKTARRIHDAWRGEPGSQPRRVFRLPMEPDAREVLCFPWTRLAACLCDYSVDIVDWVSGVSTTVPLQIGAHRHPIWENGQLFPDNVYVFRADEIDSNVLAVSFMDWSNGRPENTTGELQLFIVDEATGTASHLVTIEFPYVIASIGTSGSQLAVHAFRRGSGEFTLPVSYLYSIDIGFRSLPVVKRKSVVRVDGWDITPSSSICIFDRTHFLVAGKHGLAVFHVPIQVSADRELVPCWSDPFIAPDLLYRPRLGPVEVDPVDGGRSVIVCGGNKIRRVDMSAGSEPIFRVSAWNLEDTGRMCPNFNFCAGFGVGAINSSSSMPASLLKFTIFPLGGPGGSTGYPFERGWLSSGRGHMEYRLNHGDHVEVNSLQVDEANGHIAFLLFNAIRSKHHKRDNLQFVRCGRLTYDIDPRHFAIIGGILPLSTAYFLLHVRTSRIIGTSAPNSASSATLSIEANYSLPALKHVLHGYFVGLPKPEWREKSGCNNTTGAFRCAFPEINKSNSETPSEPTAAATSWRQNVWQKTQQAASVLTRRRFGREGWATAMDGGGKKERIVWRDFPPDAAHTSRTYEIHMGSEDLIPKPGSRIGWRDVSAERRSPKASRTRAPQEMATYQSTLPKKNLFLCATEEWWFEVAAMRVKGNESVDIGGGRIVPLSSRPTSSRHFGFALGDMIAGALESGDQNEPSSLQTGQVLVEKWPPLVRTDTGGRVPSWRRRWEWEWGKTGDARDAAAVEVAASAPAPLGGATESTRATSGLVLLPLAVDIAGGAPRTRSPISRGRALARVGRVHCSSCRWGLSHVRLDVEGEEEEEGSRENYLRTYLVITYGPKSTFGYVGNLFGRMYQTGYHLLK
ncbi:hypothetical protein B0H11DRAFT_1915248 [Mycena galericulata]|nr:hypothetical protein B0H11DRAFT_1915248 [Mycena galericulata]